MVPAFFRGGVVRFIVVSHYGGWPPATRAARVRSPGVRIGMFTAYF